MGDSLAAAVGARRRANEDARALQTMACCGGLPRENHVAFAAAILHTFFHLSPGLLRARGRVWCEMCSINEHMDDVEKHMLGALCKDLQVVNRDKYIN